MVENTAPSKSIKFPARIVITKRKNDSGKILEHWHITIPTTVRELIDRKNKVINVTLEPIA